MTETMTGKYVVVWRSQMHMHYLRRRAGGKGDFYTTDIKQAVTFNTYEDLGPSIVFGDEIHIVMSVDPPVTIQVLT